MRPFQSSIRSPLSFCVPLHPFRLPVLTNMVPTLVFVKPRVALNPKPKPCCELQQVEVSLFIFSAKGVPSGPESLIKLNGEWERLRIDLHLFSVLNGTATLTRGFVTHLHSAASSMPKQVGPKPSHQFYDLIKAIGEIRSKQEEDRIMSAEVAQLKILCAQRDSSTKMNRELLIRMIYCEMLGYDASFGHILAVNMTQQNTIPDKRVGYLACTVLLHENHELMIMITNSFRRDLRDKNYLVVAAALNTVSRLINNETIPVIMPLVVELLKHPTDLIRKKAIMVLHRIWLKSPDQLPNIGEHARAMLCDKDPSVMGAALCLLVDLCKQFPTRFKDLVPSFVSILKQITEHRLPKDFDYHRMPAPWLQMGLLRLIAILGQDDQHTSEGAYEVLGDVMRRADSGINIGHAVIYECVRTIATIYPCSSLLEQAATSISRFITSDNYNLKYLGITALAQIVQLDPKYIGSHQLEVLDCLEDNDETLKRKTLDLLFRISNPSNVQLVTDKLLGSLEQCGTVQMAEEDIYKSELITKITALAEKYAPTNVWYAPTNVWYVDIINRVFLLGGDLVPAAVGDNMLQLITEGSGEDEQADAELRAHAVDAYMDMAREKPVLSDTLVTLMAWVLGEHGPALLDPQQIVETLVRLMDRDLKISTTRHAIVQALMKVCASMGRCPPAVLTLVEKYADSMDVELQQYADSMDVELQQMCYEFRALAQAPAEIFAQVLPQGGSTEDLEV
ncbi:Adaptor protein complex 4 (AP-4); epsilon subunit; B [Paratrimastix pyriformis]|uniref:AP-4 complex subunit epsilon n=1 Tax=Paratrimastix pyriformis TaxID=342808 RepID=A0ABQ8ULY5_9EUKA|nr:Adaptor protein complex 4 (AP-4); epsilon subunit; B [Paratrimastix pyriformis]